jgi:hypothetical protein
MKNSWSSFLLFYAFAKNQLTIENIIWNKNKHLIFHKIINQFKIYSESFNDSEWIDFIDSTRILFAMCLYHFRVSLWCFSDISCLTDKMYDMFSLN